MRVFDVESGTDSEISTFPPGMKLSETDLEPYLDDEIADQGVVGGEVRLNLKDGSPSLDVDYWIQCFPSARVIDALEEFTVAQLEDGIGEGGFECDVYGSRVRIVPNVDYGGGVVEVTDDGREVFGPPGIAMAARDGDLFRLKRALEAEPSGIERLHQGGSALHLAILSGHREAVRILLAAGANPNRVDAHGLTPLEACALSGSLDDAQSREVGQLLLDAGGCSLHVAPTGESARELARLRGKELLAAIL